MSIFDAVKTGINAILNTQSHQDSQELRYWHEMNQRQTGFAPRTLYRLVNPNSATKENPSGDMVGFCYCCKCGTSYECHDACTWYKTLTCGCGHEFNIWKILGIPADADPSDYEKYFKKIPISPRLTQTNPQQTPPGMAIGYHGDDNPAKSAADWAGDKAAEARADINNGLW